MLNIPLLRTSFRQLRPQGEEMIARFYDVLFARYPEMGPLYYRTSLYRQQIMVMQAMTFIVENLDQPDRMEPYLRDLGARHIGYGASAIHYPKVAQTFLDVIGEYLGANWTPEVRHAWTEAMDKVTAIMLGGAVVSQAA